MLVFLENDIYKMNVNYIRENAILVSIIIFLFIFGLIQMAKPLFLYNKDGSIRAFGIGYRNKTILPIWLLAIVLGILSYISVIFYVANYKLFLI
jgi:hypothetical protein